MNLPEIDRPAAGIQVIQAITSQPTTTTIEGEIGALLWGGLFQSYIMDMPAGAYLDEHPHPFESVIYAVSGRYVLCSNGVRCVLEPGSLMAFDPNVPTGYEIPFDESAVILVFRGGKPDLDPATFVARLQGFAADGPAWLRDLPHEHPARQFARQINPMFDDVPG